MSPVHPQVNIRDLSACTAAAVIFVSRLKKGMILVLNLKNHGTATNLYQFELQSYTYIANVLKNVIRLG